MSSISDESFFKTLQKAKCLAAQVPQKATGDG